MSETRNLELVVEYTGEGFAGWQYQPKQRTLAGEIQRALSEITQEPVHLVSASRTDAGVHALGQVANFQTSCQLNCGKLCEGVNSIMPEGVKLRRIREVPLGFHARFSARGKHYRYRILNRAAPSPQEVRSAWHVAGRLDLAAMQHAASLLVGEQDYRALVTRNGNQPRPEETGDSCVRRLRAVVVSEEPQPVSFSFEGLAHEAHDPTRGRVFEVNVVGDAFLYKMVRTLAGTIVYAGLGKLSPASIPRLLRGGDRHLLGPTAPAHGLTLMRVFYPEDAPLTPPVEREGRAQEEALLERIAE